MSGDMLHAEKRFQRRRRLISMAVGVLVVLGAIALACRYGALVDRFNLLGQTRFQVGQQLYGIEMMEWTSSQLTISLVRAWPTGQIDGSDAAAIAAVEGVVLVDASGARIPVADVIAEPEQHESGFVTIVFDVGGHEGPWELVWPDHEPYTIGP